MSTDRRYQPPLFLALAVATVSAVATACRSPTVTSIDMLCGGAAVQESLELVVDSVRPQGGAPLERLRGSRHRLTLTLLAAPASARPCQDQSGEGTFDAALPDAMAAAVHRPPSVHWQVQGTEVQVNLNPNVADNNLLIRLPLDGRDGRWEISTLVGAVALGRAVHRM